MTFADDYMCHERCAQEKLFFPLFIWAGGDTETEEFQRKISVLQFAIRVPLKFQEWGLLESHLTQQISLDI